jgi:alcohol dehydrogenase (cytochrome c)
LNSGSVIAVNPATGEQKWRYEMLRGPAGLLATGGGLIFAGDWDGYLIALDAGTGKVLWHFQTGAEIRAPPISYSLRGQQYFAVMSGPNLIAFHLR